MPARLKSVALYYTPEGYSTKGSTLMGINAASEGFLHALLRHGDLDRVTAVAESPVVLPALQAVAGRLGAAVKTRYVSTGALQSLEEDGVLYLPGPGLGGYARMRRRVGAQSFSLCGVTHTTASPAALDALADLLVAPVQPWDALVCPSSSVKAMVQRLLVEEGAYLCERFAGRRPESPQMPVIPLGVDVAGLAPHPKARAEARSAIGLSKDDVALLFVGRLSPISKAHPIPLFLAAAHAARTTGVNIRLILAGWFDVDATPKVYEEAFNLICPDVTLTILDGRDSAQRARAWNAADIFISPSDNIQESFGLTPIEAMAAGLPVVASAWDGYRETVRHGIDGFLASTVAPPSGAGLELAAAYGARVLQYGDYVGFSSQTIAVSVLEMGEALGILIKDEGLRRQMGESGRRRANELYSWRRVISLYQDLWDELRAIRLASPKEVTPPNPYPSRPDPYTAFADYLTEPLSASRRVVVGKSGPQLIDYLLESPLTAFSAQVIARREVLHAFVSAVSDSPSIVIEALFECLKIEDQAVLWRSLCWLLKYDVLRLV